MADSETFELERLLRHSDWLTSLARQLVAAAKADDLVQETWLAALRNAPHGIRSPRAWLARVVRRLARARSLSVGIDEPSAAKEDVAPTDEVMARIEGEQWLARLVLELEEPYRGVVLQHFYQGLTASRIARIEGVPAATVRTRLRRALTSLRERLEREGGVDRRGWPLASLFLVRDADSLVTLGKGALLMGTKTTLTVGLASGALCALVVTEGILPTLEERARVEPARVAIERDSLASAATRRASTEGSASPSPDLAADPSSERRLEAAPARAVPPEDLRRLLLSSDRIEQVRAIQALIADGSADANHVLLDAFYSTSDRVLLALLEEALLDPSLDVAGDVIEAYLASEDPLLLGRATGLLAQLARARPELEAEVIGHFLAALEDVDRSPERASASTEALASLGIAALDELADYLVGSDSGTKGVGSAAWLIAQLPEEYGEDVRQSLAESLRGSLEALGDPNASADDRNAVLEKTGSLAWSASLRPAQEHDRLGEVLLENLLATQDPAQAGSLGWGLGNLPGLSEGSRITAARSLLDALSDQADDSLRQQYLRTVRQLAVAQPQGPSFDELVRWIEDARSLHVDGLLASRLDALLSELRTHD